MKEKLKNKKAATTASLSPEEEALRAAAAEKKKQVRGVKKARGVNGSREEDAGLDAECSQL